MDPLIIHTEGGGNLAADCPPSRVRDIAQEMAKSKHVVIHLHGGLVSEAVATEMAKRLDPYYRAAGLLPVFFVWETHFFETVPNNFRRIMNEPIFRELALKLLKYAAGLILKNAQGGRGIGGSFPLPAPVKVQAEYQKLNTEDVPYGQYNTRESNTARELTPEEEKQLEADLEKDIDSDKDFTQEIANILAGLELVPPPGSRASATPPVPKATELEADIKAELSEQALQPGARGFLSSAAWVFARHGVTILVRVVRRFTQKRDHGLYPTLVEEIFREMYIDSVGALLWGSMKNDARDTFVKVPGKNAGGALLLEEYLAANPDPGAKISVVGHSAGSIFASEMLKHVAAAHPDFALHKLVFLAPAVNCEAFARVLDLHQAKPLWKSFRSYALSDEWECAYWEVKGLYSRSLLYLVSGLTEREGDESDINLKDKSKSAFDKPLVGMQRYIAWEDVYKDPAVLSVRAFLKQAGMNHQVWAPTEPAAAVDLTADSNRHGGFDETAGEQIKTMKAVTAFLGI